MSLQHSEAELQLMKDIETLDPNVILNRAPSNLNLGAQGNKSGCLGTTRQPALTPQQPLEPPPTHPS